MPTKRSSSRPIARKASRRPPRTAGRGRPAKTPAARALKPFPILELPSRERLVALDAAPGGASFLVGGRAHGVGPLRIRAAYDAERLGALHIAEASVIASALAMRPSAPDGAGFAAIAAYEDDSGLVTACPLSFDGLPLATHSRLLSPANAVAGEPAAAAGNDRFWVAYELAGEAISLQALTAQARPLGGAQQLRVEMAGTHHRPRLAAAHGGVAVVFTVSGTGPGAGTYFAFATEDHATAPLWLSNAPGEARLARGSRGFLVAVAHPDSFALLEVFAESALAATWSARQVADDLEGSPLALGGGEILAWSRRAPDRVVRYRADGSLVDRWRLGHPVVSAARGPRQWLVLGAEGREGWAALVTP